MGRHYKKKVGDDIIKYPSVTTIIGECDPKNWGPQWGANMCKQWIIENCDLDLWYDSANYGCVEGYVIDIEQLHEMRFNFRKISKKASDIGSEVHNAIEMYLQKKLYKIPSSGEIFEAFGGYFLFIYCHIA